MADQGCEHLAAVGAVKPAMRYECDECVKISARWVHLRVCQEAAQPGAATTPRISTLRNTPARANILLSPQVNPENDGCIAIPTMPSRSIDAARAR